VLDELADDEVKVDDTPVGQGVRALGALLAIWTAGKALEEAHPGEAQRLTGKLVSGLITRGPTGAAALADALRVLRVTILGRSALRWCEVMGRYATVIGGGVTAVLNAIALADDLAHWESSPEHVARALADGLAIVSGVAAILGATGVGMSAAVAVLALRWIVRWLHDRDVARQRRADKLAALRQMGLDDALAATLSRADADVLATLGSAGVPPSTVQLLARLVPDEVEADGRQLQTFGGLERAQGIFRLDGAALSGLVLASAGDGAAEDRAEHLVLALNWMEREPRFQVGRCPDSALRLIEQAIAGAGSAPFEVALANAHGYLARHVPVVPAAQCYSDFE